MALTVVVLAFRAKQRRGYGPLILGLLASACVMLGKFYFDSISSVYGGVALLFLATVWNAWPRKRALPNTKVQISGLHERRL